LLKSERKIKLSMFLCFLLLLVLIGSCDTSTNPTNTSGVRYKPETYTASARGFMGDIKASVSFSEEKIIAITIDEHNETIGRDRVASAIKNISDAIVQSQSLEVDVVSGATYTSKAIKEAVKNCVLEAIKDT
jgi:uncharacterized protein with FMN-binding domain